MTSGWLLDTNVLSETARPQPNAAVLTWLEGQAPLRMASVTLFELARGVRRVPTGRRRRFLDEWLATLLAEDVQVLAFDERAAMAAATIEREAQRRGRPVADRDLFILATAATQNLSLATHDIADFRGHGVALYDPFDDVHVPA